MAPKLWQLSFKTNSYDEQNMQRELTFLSFLSFSPLMSGFTAETTQYSHGCEFNWLLWCAYRDPDCRCSSIFTDSQYRYNLASVKMMKQIVLLAAIACAAVLADNYNCGNKGDKFECFESAASARFCLTGGAQPEVICGKCRKKADFCTKGLVLSKRPEVDCGAGYASTPCTTANSAVPATF
ncbi:schistosomin-like [Elysia marginata]|uniref:Schistosomin-like n=1 Tax=Elysia marginata TaxID=1093978 RepID=A0AAV4JYQ2_9GAST|nr:schistosomin-like [Elysia marginata]